MIEFYLRGDQIGTYDSLRSIGNGNGLKVDLDGVEALGSSDQVYRIVVRQASEGAETLRNGQWVDVYAWPGTPDAPPLLSNLNPQHDMYQGMAASPVHQIFTNQKIVIDLDGLPTGDLRYGRGGKRVDNGDFGFTHLQDVPNIVCFVDGTMIKTAAGEQRIEDIAVDDVILTADHGPRPVRWIGSATVPGKGRFAPIMFIPGAIGNKRTLRVSPQHRMLIRDWRAELWFGVPQVLVAAKHLVNDHSIRPLPCAFVTYYHMMFDEHEIVFAEDVPSESLHPGHVALSSLGAEARAEILELFPGLLSSNMDRQTAKPCLKRWEGTLFSRHQDLMQQHGKAH